MCNRRNPCKPVLCLDMSYAAQNHRTVTFLSSEPGPQPVLSVRPSAFVRPPFYATQILDFLYLGSFTDAMQCNDMLDKGITHVLNVARECDSKTSDSFKFLKVDVSDHSDEDIRCHFEQCFAFIEDAKRHSGKVLVHCRQGISRSATVVIAYLMQSRRIFCLDDALHFVQSKREKVCPNIGFILALEEYATSMALAKGSPSSSISENDSLSDTFSDNHWDTTTSKKDQEISNAVQFGLEGSLGVVF